MKVLALIPARANSKGLPGKNTVQLGGKPLIGWTIEAAQASRYASSVVVSTDGEFIASVARRLGASVPFLRPAHLARDNTPGVTPVIHACRALPGYDIVVLLQPTSPLRTAADIDGAIDTLLEQNADFCISVTQPKHHPNWLFSLDKAGCLKRYEKTPLQLTRQSLTPVYAPNGAVYVARVSALLEQETLVGEHTSAYVMEADRSWDIDTALDLQVCEVLLHQVLKNRTANGVVDIQAARTRTGTDSA